MHANPSWPGASHPLPGGDLAGQLLKQLVAEAAPHSASPDRRLSVFFDALAERVDGISTASRQIATEEPNRADGPGSNLDDFLRRAAIEAGVGDPEDLVAELLIVIRGALVSAAGALVERPGTMARAIALRLIAEAQRG